MPPLIGKAEVYMERHRQTMKPVAEIRCVWSASKTKSLVSAEKTDLGGNDGTGVPDLAELVNGNEKDSVKPPRLRGSNACLRTVAPALLDRASNELVGVLLLDYC